MPAPGIRPGVMKVSMFVRIVVRPSVGPPVVRSPDQSVVRLVRVILAFWAIIESAVVFRINGCGQHYHRRDRNQE
jgi:hypothetical protein